MKRFFPAILFLLLYSKSDAQRTIAPNDPVYFNKVYLQAKEQFYLLSVKRATAHYYQFYNDVARQKQAKEITMLELYPDSLVTDTNLLISQVNTERYHKGFLIEEFRIKYLRPAGNPGAAIAAGYDTLDWKQYSYTKRKRNISVQNKRYGRPDNYTDSLRIFYFSRKKRLQRTVTRNDTVRETDTRFTYRRSGELAKVSSVVLDNGVAVEEKRWVLRYSREREGASLPRQILDSAGNVPALAFVVEQLGGTPSGSQKIAVTRFEKLPQEENLRQTGIDSVSISCKGDYRFVCTAGPSDTSVQIGKVKGKLMVQRVYLELGIRDEGKRAFRYTSRQIVDGSIIYENNFRGKLISGSCSLDPEKTIINDTEDGSVKLYRIKR